MSAYTLNSLSAGSGICCKSVKELGNSGKLRLSRDSISFRAFQNHRQSNYKTCILASTRDDSATVNTASLESDVLQHFFSLSEGFWKGNYNQFHFSGDLVHSVPIEVIAQICSEGENKTLKQSLRVLQAPSKTRDVGEPEEGEVWREIALEETNKFTMDRRQQLSMFEKENAFAVSHATATIIDQVLRIGIVGPDDEEEEHPRGVRLPSTRPALVCECCLYGEDEHQRIRAFHVLDPRGFINTIGVFQEARNSSNSSVNGTTNEQCDGELSSVNDHLGEWKGSGYIQRSSLYGGSRVYQESKVVLRRESDGSIIQDLTISVNGASRGMTSRASVDGSLLEFNGLQMSILSSGIYMSCPTAVKRGQAFAFECGWIYGPNKRKRIQRIYDSDGMVVSTALYAETRG